MSTKSVRKTYGILPQKIWFEIRRQYVTGTSQAEICRRFGVPRSTVTARRESGGWDLQREEYQAARRRLGRVYSGDSAGFATDPGGRSAGDPADGMTAQEHVSAPPYGACSTEVRNGGSGAGPSGVGALQEAYRQFADAILGWIEFVAVDVASEALTGGRLTRDLLDAVKVLEKLQQIEQAARGPDDPNGHDHRRIVVVPAKRSCEEWQESAHELV